MRATGKEIIEQAFALLGTFAPGERVEDRLIKQGVFHANAQLESLALESQYIPGETIQVLRLRRGVSEYWLGPEFTQAGTPDAPVAPFGLRTSGVPEEVVRAALVVTDVNGEVTQFDNDAGVVNFRVPANDSEAAHARGAYNARVPGEYWLILHDGTSGPGPGPVRPPGRTIPAAEPDDQRSFVRGSRKLEVLPAPAVDVDIRLYLRVPEINVIVEAFFYEFPPGVGRVLLTQIASALATVHGVDPDTRRAVEDRAAQALASYTRKNARFRRPLAHLPRKWLGTVSDDGTAFEIREVPDR